MNIFIPLALLLLSPAPQGTPETVFHNARVFTADPGRPQVEAISVKEGRILAVGASSDLLRTAGGENVCAADATRYPVVTLEQIRAALADGAPERLA